MWCISFPRVCIVLGLLGSALAPAAVLLLMMTFASLWLLYCCCRLITVNTIEVLVGVDWAQNKACST
jgi:hypothetical protein